MTAVQSTHVLNICLIDFNYIQLKNKISINECSIFDFSKKTGQTFHITASKKIQYIIKHNREAQKQFNWTKTSGQNIPVEYGTVSFTSLIRYMEKYVIDEYDYILVKGNAKQDFLNETFEKRINIFNLDHFGCPSLAHLRSVEYPLAEQESCLLHDRNFKFCTALKINLMYRWLVDNLAGTFYRLRQKRDCEIAACNLELPYL